jgi:nitric oxide reductase subunit B
MMGVYGMLAVGFFVFVAAYFVPHNVGRERAMKASFYALNGGLAWMVCVNLFPIGVLQFRDALLNGYWHARSPAFFARDDVRWLEWLRMPGDVVFIVGGIVPLVYLAVRMVAHRNRPGIVGDAASLEDPALRSDTPTHKEGP